jgi:hypothetical protein
MKTPLTQRKTLWALLPVLLLGACASPMPPGPHVTVMPAPGKPFEQFRMEDQECRNYAQSSIGTEPAKASNETVAQSAVVGGLIGAAIGSAMGGRHDGTAMGASMGVLAGTSAGASQSSRTAYDLQRRYDVAYSQCMYAKGNQLPQAGYQPATRQNAPRYLPPPAYYPPPPPAQ